MCSGKRFPDTSDQRDLQGTISSSSIHDVSISRCRYVPSKVNQVSHFFILLGWEWEEGGISFLWKTFSEKYTLLLIALLESPKDFKREALCKGSKTLTSSTTTEIFISQRELYWHITGTLTSLFHIKMSFIFWVIYFCMLYLSLALLKLVYIFENTNSNNRKNSFWTFWNLFI